MTNAEKYLKENVNVDEFVSNFLHECNCPREDLEMFLNDEIKPPTLSEDEKVILRNISQEKYKHIGRDERGYLYIAQRNKNDFSGRGMNLAVYDVFGHLFQFIKDGEEYSIKELLKDERNAT